MSSEVTEFEIDRKARRGVLFVVSSPSGGGKGTLIKRVLSTVPNLGYSVSYTTRPPRNGEVNGREYFFVTTDQFEAMIAAEEFLEWAHVHGKLYGTSRQQVSQEISQGRDIILEVDVQGAASVRQLLPDAVTIFILPPSLETLRKRLLARGTDSEEELELRLRNAPNELRNYKDFDFVIINENVERATNQLRAVINAERVRPSHQEDSIQTIIKNFMSE